MKSKKIASIKKTIEGYNIKSDLNKQMVLNQIKDILDHISDDEENYTEKREYWNKVKNGVEKLKFEQA